MALSDLKRDLTRIGQRRAAVYISDTGGTGTHSAWRNAGEVRDVRVSFKPVSTSKSTRGSVKQVGVQMEVSFVMMQTSDTEITNIPTILRENANGTTIKFTNKPKDASSVAGWVFLDASLEFEGELPFDGSESMVSFKFTAEFDVNDLDDFFTVAASPVASQGVVAGDRVFSI